MGPYDFFLPPVFDVLPEAVADRLLAGVFGRKQATQTGLAALRAAAQSGARGALCARLGLELSLLAFDLDPGNAMLAQGILALAGPGGSAVAPDVSAALTHAAAGGLGPYWSAAVEEAERTGEWSGICRGLEGGCAGASDPLAGPLAMRLAGLAALAAGEETPIAVWRAGLPDGPLSPGLAFLRARAVLRLDGREAGMAAMRAFLARYPWCAQTVLALHDLERGRDAALTPLPGRLAILLYSWNKAEELGRALEGIVASDLPDFRIFALDNGSADATPDVLAAFADRLGPDRFTALGAPVNVGAPAGRNWLKHLPEVLACDYAAYIDDDASLPRDWALRFGAAAAAYPQAGVYGCRVHDAGWPATLQAAEFLVEPAGAVPGLAASDLQLQAPDVGQFAYCRPTLSVTGCCHLFPVGALAGGGDFDIRFSPSQFDDFDRDLRVALAGGHAVFQGHLAVGHLRASGGDAARRRAAGANAHGNMHKLQGKYDAGDGKRLRRAQRDLLLTDLRKKAIWLARHAPGGASDKEGDL